MSEKKKRNECKREKKCETNRYTNRNVPIVMQLEMKGINVIERRNKNWSNVSFRSSKKKVEKKLDKFPYTYQRKPLLAITSTFVIAFDHI